MQWQRLAFYWTSSSAKVGWYTVHWRLEAGNIIRGHFLLTKNSLKKKKKTSFYSYNLLTLYSKWVASDNETSIPPKYSWCAVAWFYVLAQTFSIQTQYKEYISKVSSLSLFLRRFVSGYRFLILKSYGGRSTMRIKQYIAQRKWTNTVYGLGSFPGKTASEYQDNLPQGKN